MKKLGPKYISGILVGMQMVCILFLLVKVPSLQSDLWALIVSFAGLMLGFWAVVSMKLDNLSVTPDVKKDARLVMAGPYKVIRHPMYSAVLLTFIPFVIDRPSVFLCVVYMALLTTLVIKLNYEETLLKIHFKGYEAYSKKSWRLIPFIY
jgi:protein-S-isoprenylcysteine O-methyltransferase Ste14